MANIGLIVRVELCIVDKWLWPYRDSNTGYQIQSLMY